MIELRRCEKYTVYRSTETIKLDPEKFRNLEGYPYTGETDEDFLNYLNDSDFSLPEYLKLNAMMSVPFSRLIQIQSHWLSFDPILLSFWAIGELHS